MPNRSEQLNKLLERFYPYILAFVLGVIGLVMINFLIWPQYNHMLASGILQYKSSTDVVAQRKAYLAQLQAMQAEYEVIDQRIIRAVDIALPVGYSAGPVYAEIDQLLANTKFTVQSVNVATATSSDTDTDTTLDTANPDSQVYEQVLISLNISSSDPNVSYSDFKTLLNQIEKNPHLMNLDSIVYTPDTAAYTFVLKTYQRKADL